MLFHLIYSNLSGVNTLLFLNVRSISMNAFERCHGFRMKVGPGEVGCHGNGRRHTAGIRTTVTFHDSLVEA
jgi:hypothetical protein